MIYEVVYRCVCVSECNKQYLLGQIAITGN